MSMTVCDLCHKAIISEAFLQRCTTSGSTLQLHRKCLQSYKDALLLESMIHELDKNALGERRINTIDFKEPIAPNSSPEKIKNVWVERSALKDEKVKRKIFDTEYNLDFS